MKRFIAITAIVTATLGLFSCEKHSWEKETKKLYHHGDHKEHDKDAKHDADHKAHDHDHSDGDHSH